MNSRFTAVETSLNAAEFRWKWLRLVEQSALLGVVLCGLVIGLGAAIIGGWLSSQGAVLAWLVTVGVLGLIAWVVIVIRVMLEAPERGWLAAALERVDSRLLDRLNTLLFLERQPRDERTEGFALRIARQVQGLVALRACPKPFRAGRALLRVALFGLVLSATVGLYQRQAPWGRLLAKNVKVAAPLRPDKPLELSLPPTNNLEQNQLWGEVRITEPGADLKVTKVDVVPLQIEAAANQALKQVNWYSAVNGSQETAHELPQPSEQRFAVYQPNLYLDELRLADWDVLTYYAKANTDKKSSYASEVYFLEVRPFREDILKMPGGEGGSAYQGLNEISTLINRQQHVIRQTHQHAQRPPEQANLEAQERKKLSGAEADLSESSRHLYAKLAAEMENKPIGEVLDSLAKAEKSLTGASQRLESNLMAEAQNRERSAMSELVAARKRFQKTISDNPNAFGDSKADSEESAPVAEPSKQLSQLAEFRNEAKAAQDFVKKALEKQKQLEQQAGSAPSSSYGGLSQQEQQLETSLKDFQEQHPQVFQGLDEPSRQAHQAMEKAAGALQQKSTEARGATQQASRQLGELSEAMAAHSAEQQLADAYKLKHLLEQQSQALGQRAKPDSKMTDAQLQKTVEATRETLSELKKSAEQEPTRDAFGQPLRDALSGQNKVELDAKLIRLQQAQSEAEKQERAAQAKAALDGVSAAFGASQPKSLQLAHQADSLKPGRQDSLGQGMGELESLIKQLESRRPVAPSDQAKQAQQALDNIQAGMRSLHGDDQQGESLLGKLQLALKGEQPLEVGNLKKLLEELEHFSVETSEQLAKKQEQPELSNIDPQRLPPAYRGRIQKYFQKLSER